MKQTIAAVLLIIVFSVTLLVWSKRQTKDFIEFTNKPFDTITFINYPHFNTPSIKPTVLKGLEIGNNSFKYNEGITIDFSIMSIETNANYKIEYIVKTHTGKVDTDSYPFRKVIDISEVAKDTLYLYTTNFSIKY